MIPRSVHVAANGVISFFFMTEQHCLVSVCVYNILFIRSSVSGHLGGFHVLAIVNSASMNTGVQVSFPIMVFAGYMSRSGVAGSLCACVCVCVCVC